MSKQDRQKLSILIVLVVVLGLTIVLGYRMNGPAVTAAVQVSETKPVANTPAPSDARIRLDLIETPESSKEEIGKKNVFQYQQTPAPVTSGSRGAAASNTPQPAQPALPSPSAMRPPATIPPPGPPPIPFKYQGYAVESAPSGQTTAFLTDDSSRHYNVRIGEILMGRYRVTYISANAVEVEDTESSRRQMLPIVK